MTAVSDGLAHDGFTDGLRIRREVLGAEYVDRALTTENELQREFQDFVINQCWASVWTDETLSRRERSLIVLAVTGALGRMPEFALHLRGAINNGVSARELAAFVKQLGVYAGIPAAVGAMQLLNRELAEHADTPDQDQP